MILSGAVPPDASALRDAIRRRLIATARQDPRIVGLVDYGSSSQGRADAWSDLDVALFLRDADLPAFERDWIAWAGQFGPLLLAYIGGVGHPWTVYAAQPVLLRVDFAFHAESALEEMRAWPTAPQSVEAMVLYDATGGRLAAIAHTLVGQPLDPPDPATTFTSVCGDFWYYILRTLGRVHRGQAWGARQDYHSIVLNLLSALLRLEVGATARWRASEAAVGLEAVLTPERLAQLERCIPGPGLTGVQAAMTRAAELGWITCRAGAACYDRPWPEALARAILRLLGTAPPATDETAPEQK
jgi:lincosamide nucleotidyltransferase